MSLRTVVLVLAGATLVGVVLTLIAGQEPGALLAVFIIAGTIAAGLGIQRNAVYLLFPMPAIAFFIASVLTGVVHDSRMAGSTVGLGTAFLQWIAAIFFPMVIATILAVLIGGGRWLLGSQLVSGQSPRPAGPSGRRPAPGNRRPPAGTSWDDDEPAAARPRGPRPGGPGPRPGTGPVPRPGTGPAPQQGTGPMPRQGTGPSPRQGSGPGPRPGTGPAPQQGTGPAPRQGTSPAPQQGAPAPRPGTGPAPQQGTGPWPGGGGPRPPRPPRDRRVERDPWGDPRLPPTGPRPQQPGSPPPTPRDGSLRPDDSWPSRPQQRHPRQHPDDWPR